MSTYLSKGWFDADESRSLRREVVDGAIDIAASLRQAGINTELMQAVALRVRSAIALGSPGARDAASFGPSTRAALRDKLDDYLDNRPELDGFIGDCLDHLHSPGDLVGLYLHLIHISRMLGLLDSAAMSAIGDISPASDA